jgi:hypothetical protein
MHVVATGTCSQGWNLVEFYGGDLPNQVDSGSNNILKLQINDGIPVDASRTRVVRDLKIGQGIFNYDIDMDAINVLVKSKANPQVTVKGRTLYIENGGQDDIVKVKVKWAKDTGDRAAKICGIFTDGGLKQVNIRGSLDRLEVTGMVKAVKLKLGSLGQRNRSLLDYIRFKTYFNKTMIKVKDGDVNANMAVNSMYDEDPAGSGGLKALMVVGGNFGMEGTGRWLRAASIAKVLVKDRKAKGGTFADYALFLNDECIPGSDLSIKQFRANMVVDSSLLERHTKVVCGYDRNEIPDPRDIISWRDQPVEHSVGKIIIKGLVFEGTYVLDKPPVKSRIPTIVRVIWIIKGKEQ